MVQHELFRVLLVDDDIGLLETMAAILCERFLVRTATSGEEALAVLERECFHVVCADWQMPGMDGVEFFRTVATKRYAIQPCFILVTAHAADLLDQVAYDDRKVLGVLYKPFSPDQLLDRVQQFAGVAQLKRSSATLQAVILGGDRK